MELLSLPGQQILIVLLLLFCTASSFSQSADEISAIAGKGKYSEELYVRTDRDIYIVGESVIPEGFLFQ